MRLRLSLCAVLLAVCAVPARAASVTYNLIEGPDGPNPGTVAAILVFASPPASPDSAWTTTGIGDILSWEIIDPAGAPAGSYAPFTLTEGFSSPTGATLDQGDLTAHMGSQSVFVAASPAAGNDRIGPLGTTRGEPIAGDWVLAAATVPEPSSAVLVGTAALAGLAAWPRRQARRWGRRTRT
jgi:hypothetical protein